jgi:hypothetical protein
MDFKRKQYVSGALFKMLGKNNYGIENWLLINPVLIFGFLTI